MAHVTWALEIAGQKKKEVTDDCVLNSVGVRPCLLGSCAVGLPANKKGEQAPAAGEDGHCLPCGCRRSGRQHLPPEQTRLLSFSAAGLCMAASRMMMIIISIIGR